MTDSRLPITDDRGLRRRFLAIMTGLVGGVGLLFSAIPFVASWKPSARARARAAPIKVRLDRIGTGELHTASWAGSPVWVLKRTPAMLAELTDAGLVERLRDPESAVTSQQPDYARNTGRSIEPDVLVLIGLCTHLGCIPSYYPDPEAPPPGTTDWPGGFFCPCHGSKFDLAGRVFTGVPAPTNLVVPRHRYLDGNTIEVGRDR